MRKAFIALFAALALLPAGAEELQWLTDLSKAQAQAKKENKMVMMDFTGSDWCIWCKRLNKDVFSTEDFANYAKKNLVLVEVDFPRSKSQTAEQKKANSALAEKYQIEGYPTIVVLDGDGKKLGVLNYMNSPKPFIAKLDELKKQGT